MWTPVGINDLATIARCVDMKRTWGSRSTLASARSALRHGYRAFYYQNGGVELVWVFHYNARHAAWFSEGGGAAGSLTTQQAADRVIGKLVGFMADEGASVLYEFRPAVERNPVVADFYTALRGRPEIAAAIESEMSDAVLWRYQRAGP